jgi:hypothetical protein
MEGQTRFCCRRRGVLVRPRGLTFLPGGSFCFCTAAAAPFYPGNIENYLKR